MSATATAGDPVIREGDAIIRVGDVRKRYGDVRAVDGVTFSVSSGQIFGLLGPNGAGKTTTVEMLEGLRQPDSGSLEVLGIDVARHPDALKERIGVALALVNDPEVVFLDEPTTGLDPAARRALWSLVDRLREQGKTVLLTTHYMEEAEALCDRVAIMDHGRILDMGSVGDLVSRRFQEKAVQFDRIDGLDDERLSAIAAVTSVRHDDGKDLLYSRDVPATIRDLLGVSEAMAVEPQNLTIRRATLEDVFLDLTGRALRD